jgi:DNA-binding transcriptional MerR regulator
MPYKEKPVEKVYYPIGEVAQMFGLSTSLLRYWENEFDILQPRKNRKGDRFFTRADIANLQIIYSLLKEQGFTIKGAKKHLQQRADETREKARMIESLQKVRGFLEELKAEL